VADDLDTIGRFGAVFFDSYFVVDKDRRIQKHNTVFEQMLGLRPAQRRAVDGAHCYELLQLEICKDRCIAVECLKRNAPVRMEEIKGKTPSGRELVLELSAIPLREESGAVVGVFVTHRDVTDERRLKTRFTEAQADHDKALAELKARVAAQDEELVQLRSKKA
jgi:PAS domain S-box-containing protein